MRSTLSRRNLLLLGSALLLGWLTGCNGTRVWVDVTGPSGLDITRLDVTAINGPGLVTRLLEESEVGPIELPTSFGIRLRNPVPGTIEVCIDTFPEPASGCSARVPLVLGGRNDVSVPLSVGPPKTCGDGVLDPGEVCDGAELDGEDCFSVNPLFTGGTLGCEESCLALDTTLCFQVPPVCGDGVADPGEVCDGADLVAQDCTTAGNFPGGTLACAAGCMSFDTSGCDLSPTVPIPIRPENGASIGTVHAAGTLRPHVYWLGSTVSGGYTIGYEVEYALDATFTMVLDTGTTPNTNFMPSSDLAVSMTVPVGDRVFWRVRACANNACSAWSDFRWLFVGRSPRDFNGDGYDDIAIGAPLGDSGGADSGAVHVWSGGPSSSATLIPGTAGGDWTGHSVAWAGDLNGDGYADLLVGAPLNDGGAIDAGAAFVYLGGPGGVLDLSADTVIQGSVIGEQLGYSVAAAGDVNNDGLADLIVGAPFGGAAYVHLGNAGGVSATPDVTLAGAGGEFGWAVSTAGDVDNDGFADVIVGAPVQSNGGAAHIFVGGAPMNGGSDWSVANGAFNGYARAVSAAGDLTADGFGDVLIGVRTDNEVDVHFGMPGIASSPSDTLSTVLNGGAWFGWALAAGDINCDGLGDVIVGAPFAQGTAVEGAWFAYFGAPGGAFDNMLDVSVFAGAPSDELGWSVAAGSDINGDGCDDLLVGARRAGGNGYVLLYYGSSSFNPLSPGPVTFTNGTPDWFGTSVD